MTIPASHNQLGLAQAVNIIIRYFAASNWTIIHHRLKNRFAYYCGSEDSLGLSDLAFIDFASLDKHRLVALLPDIRAGFTSFKRPAQAAIAVSLRHAIWRWAEAYPDELLQMQSSESDPLEASATLLFDICYSMADNSKKRAHIWPLLATLLLLCPTAILKIAGKENNKHSAASKLALFLDLLRKSCKSNKTSEGLLASCLDVCKVILLSPPPVASILRRFTPDLEYEVKVSSRLSVFIDLADALVGESADA